MPEISRFYGIIILMNFLDHSPPHFHAWYNEFKITVTIDDGIVNGEMPTRALKLIFKWLDLHREELVSLWNQARNGVPLQKIEPLK